METTTRRRPTTAADLHRLAGVAHERQLTLFQEESTGAWFCSSASDVGALYYVTGYTCTCRGFVAHGRCSHHALLLERLGWLPAAAPALPLEQVLATEIDACLSGFATGLDKAPIVTTTVCDCGALDPELSCPLRSVVAAVAHSELEHVARCPDCYGDGFIKIMVGGRFSDWIPGTCHRCEGSGTVRLPLAS